MASMPQQRAREVYINLSIVHNILSYSYEKAAFHDSTAGRLALSYPSVKQIA